MNKHCSARPRQMCDWRHKNKTKKKYKKYKREWAKLKNKEKVEQKEDKLTKRTYVGALCEWYRV